MGRYRDSGKRIRYHRVPYPCHGSQYRHGGKLVGQDQDNHTDDYDYSGAAASAFCGNAMIENILVGLAVFFTIVSGVDYIVKNKQVLKG